MKAFQSEAEITHHLDNPVFPQTSTPQTKYDRMFLSRHVSRRIEKETLEVCDGGVRLRKPFVDLVGSRGTRLDLDALFESQDPVRLPAVSADAKLVLEVIAKRLPPGIRVRIRPVPTTRGSWFPSSYPWLVTCSRNYGQTYGTMLYLWNRVPE